MNYPPTVHAFIAASGIHFASLEKDVAHVVDYHMAKSLRLLHDDLQNMELNDQSKANIIGATIALAAAEVSKVIHPFLVRQ